MDIYVITNMPNITHVSNLASVCHKETTDQTFYRSTFHLNNHNHDENESNIYTKEKSTGMT